MAYPGDTILKWSIKDFGPFYLPSRGDTIVMDDKHYLLYRNLIEWEQQDKLIASNGHFYLNGREVEHYVFMHNYYFMVVIIVIILRTRAIGGLCRRNIL